MHYGNIMMYRAYLINIFFVTHDYYGEMAHTNGCIFDDFAHNFKGKRLMQMCLFRQKQKLWLKHSRASTGYFLIVIFLIK